ncbi:unnamed protein product [Symbiodinium sp. CCMP2592]|nr:unnamed protein product [Symbiodinium sp. CCMP2592]
MEAQPSERYDVLQKYVGADQIESSEAALDRLAKRWEDESNSAADTIESVSDQLRPMAEAAESTLSDPVEWAYSELEQDVSEVESEIADIENQKTALVQLQMSATQLATAKETHIKSKEARVAAEQAVSELEAGQAGTSDLIEVLQQARDYVQQHPGPSCPVCTQDVDPTDLASLIEQRLAEYKELEEKTRVRAKCVRAEADADERVAQQREAFIAAVSGIGEKAEESTTDYGLPSINQSCEDENTEERLIDLASEIKLVIDGLVAICEEKRRLISRRNILARLVKQYTDAVESYKSSQLLAIKARELHGIVKTKRQEYSQQILNSISDETDRLYEIIHPGEGLGGSKLSMVRKSSIEQKAKFSGKDVAPGAYYSESHLDTLGFCVWVAIAKLESPENTIVVLDDVFTSVDLEHLRRIAKVIDDMIESFAQVIIVTHSRRWLDYYRLNQGSSSIGLLQLLPHSSATGIRFVDTKLPVDQLVSKLQEQPIDRQSLASMSGVLLEALLDRVCLQYERPLPRNGNMKWTLGQYLSALPEKHTKKLIVERTCPQGQQDHQLKTPYEAIKPLYEEAGLLGLVRNQVGAHFNLEGSEIPDSEVIGFGESVRDFAASISCPWCGGIPEKPSTDAYECGCKATKLKPLKL